LKLFPVKNADWLQVLTECCLLMKILLSLP